MHNTVPIQKWEFENKFDIQIGKHIKSRVQTSDQMFGTGIMKTLCFFSEGIFLVRIQNAFEGNSLLHCSLWFLLCFLRSSFFFSLFYGCICSEGWEHVFSRGRAFFATCFLLMKLWEAKACFTDLRVQGFLKARLLVSLAMSLPLDLLAF